MKNQIINIPIEELFLRSEPYFLKMCGFGREEENRDRIREAESIWEQYKDQFQFHCIVSSYSSEIFCGDTIHAENEEIICKVFQKIPKSDLFNVYFYGMCLEDVKTDGLDLLEEFYLDTWMTSFLDGGRDWLRDMFTQRERFAGNQEVFLTDAFGPGFYGIGIEEVPNFLRILNGEKIGLFWQRGMMTPAKSNVGLYLALSGESSLPSKDCANCLSSQTRCEFCKNYVPNQKKVK